MYNGKRILAIIPARGGSKGLPGKNIKMLNGKPLIGWTIEQAKNCGYIDEIFVSTDSREIAAVGEEFGIKISSLRPAELARDSSSSIDVILYTINLLEQEKEEFDIILLLEATSPLRDSEDLENALKMLVDTDGAESIVGISRTENAHPTFLVSIGERNFIRPYGKSEFIFKRRQEIDDLYFFEGSLYISYVDSLKKRKSFYHEKTLGFEMPKYKSFEVDDIVDFKIIEALMKAKQSKEI
jgi:N-acylneuraminate cytidylyltransferase/CMP-N,N'-diacetyllegionaminic acid synthase